MVFEWLRRRTSSVDEPPRDRLDSTGSQDSRSRSQSITENSYPRSILPEVNMVDSTIPEEPLRPRRMSLFERRGKIGEDEFSREYFDQMSDMWVSETDRGHSGKMGQIRGGIFSRRVPFGQDEFSREYFDTTEDMFVAESELGDSGNFRRKSADSTSAPDLMDDSPFLRIGAFLRKPVGLGKDEFSREYSRETRDFWLAEAGKEPSARLSSSIR